MNGTDAFCTNLFLSFCLLPFYESSVCPSVCLFQNALFDHLHWSASISAFKIRMHQNQLQPKWLGKSSSISNLLQTLHTLDSYFVPEFSFFRVHFDSFANILKRRCNSNSKKCLHWMKFVTKKAFPFFSAKKAKPVGFFIRAALSGFVFHLFFFPLLACRFSQHIFCLFPFFFFCLPSLSMIFFIRM